MFPKNKLSHFQADFTTTKATNFQKRLLPVHLASALNAKKIIVSNAAGAINTRFKVGDLMVIDDVFRLFP
jgi:purine-nucleoside phosphorylase